MKIFDDVEEIDFLMEGSPLIVVEEWKENTEYRNGANAKSESA